MIGLIFFGAIALWMLLALNLGRKIPQWFKLKPEWSWLFVPLVFFMPVMDEVIALPQAYVLCKQAEDAFWYDPSVKGGVLKYRSELLSRSEQVIGINIKASVFRSAHVLKEENRSVIKDMEVDFSPGIFISHFFGGTAPAMLIPASCPGSTWAVSKYQSTLNLLELTRESNPILTSKDQ